MEEIQFFANNKKNRFYKSSTNSKMQVGNHQLQQNLSIVKDYYVPTRRYLTFYHLKTSMTCYVIINQTRTVCTIQKSVFHYHYLSNLLSYWTIIRSVDTVVTHAHLTISLESFFFDPFVPKVNNACTGLFTLPKE